NRVLHFLKPASVQNAASQQVSVPVAQGSIAALFSAGGGLVSGSRLFSGPRWPTELLNRQVVINDDTAVPVYFVNGNQVNFQVPSSTPIGSQRIAARVADTGELVAGGNMLVSAAAPGLFTTNQQGTGQAIAYNQDTTANSPSNAAQRGSVIALYGTGQ